MTLPSDESDWLNKEPAPQELGKEVPEQEEIPTPVTAENILVLQAFLRIRLGQLYSNSPDEYRDSFAAICDYHDIDPSILTVQKIEGCQVGDVYRAVTTRKKTSIQNRKDMPEQIACLHSDIQIGSATFESVLRDILDTLEMLPDNALQEFIQTHYPLKMPENLHVLPSHKDLNINTEYPLYGHTMEFHHFFDAQREISTQFTRSQAMNRLADAVEKAVKEYTLVLLAYSLENPDTVEVHKLKFDEATQFKEQLFDNFTVPPNLHLGTVRNPSEITYTFALDDAFGLQTYNNTFTEADIEHVRKVLTEACSEFTSVWILFESEPTTKGVIVKIYAKK